MPRSNTPHPDESLAGYLLNLAYRLDTQPNDLIRRTGLKTTARIQLLDAQYAIGIPAEPRARFTAATGLTDVEAVNLTIERYEGLTYSPVHTTPKVARSLHGQQWVNLGRTRYCPECLTLSDRPDHVVWKVEWLTAWSVACTTHQRLLLDTCPRCEHPTGSSGQRVMSALPNADAPVAHPATCRAALTSKGDSLCGHRLDHAIASPAPQEVLSLQQTLDSILRGDATESLTSLGTLVDGPQYLRDLRLLTILLQLAETPDAITGINNPAIAAATQSYLQHRTDAINTRGRGNRTLTQPPDDTLAAAGLLISAVRLLADPTGTSAITAMHDRVRNEQPVAWDKACRTVPPSQHLFALIADTKIGFADPRRLRPHTQHQGLDITADDIPAYLSDDTYQRHFAGTDPRYERSLRRCAPMMLVRLLTDCDSTTAGRHLGYDAAPTHAAFARASDAFDHLGLDQF